MTMADESKERLKFSFFGALAGCVATIIVGFSLGEMVALSVHP